MALMNDIDTPSAAARHPSFDVLFKDVVGCALFSVVLVGAIYALLRKDFDFSGQLVALIFGALLGAIGAVLLERASSRN